MSSRNTGVRRVEYKDIPVEREFLLMRALRPSGPSEEVRCKKVVHPGGGTYAEVLDGIGRGQPISIEPDRFVKLIVR